MTGAWSHHGPVRIRFGPGALDALPAHAPKGPLLLVTSPGMTRRGVTKRAEGLLAGEEMIVFDEVGPNPSLQSVEQARSAVARKGVRGVVAIGGGSVLDTAKALSLLLAPENADVPLDAHFETGRAFPRQDPVPLLAVPTTAGTGSEVTPFATIWDDAGKRKLSLATPRLHPHSAIVDPGLTLALPPDVTLSSGLDALSHALESLWNRNATPVTCLFAERAVALILDALPRVLEDGARLGDRTRMLEGSLLAGLAIAETRTALAHSVSYPLTAHHGLTHGYACSFTLPALLRFNAAADGGRLAALARRLGHDGVEGLAVVIERLYKQTGADHRVREALGSPEALYAHMDEMFTKGRADNNVRTVRSDDVERLLRESAERVLGW